MGLSINESSSSPKGKEHLIQTLLERVYAIQKKFQEEDDEERYWLMQNSPNPQTSKLVKEMTVIMLHVLDAIGQLEPVNGITISKQFGFPKGSVSKITRKLLDMGILTTEFLPNNKKEILYRTTPLGKDIFHLHAQLHHHINHEVLHLLKKYNEDELQFLIQCMEEALAFSWTSNDSDKLNESPSLSNTEAGVNNSSPISPVISDLDEITNMLNKLDTNDLRKAKKILETVFFTS